MNTTTYRYTPSRRPVAKPDGSGAAVFAIYHNDLPFIHPVLGTPVEHASRAAAWDAATRISLEFHSSLGCFGVQRIDLS